VCFGSWSYQQRQSLVILAGFQLMKRTEGNQQAPLPKRSNYVESSSLVVLSLIIICKQKKILITIKIFFPLTTPLALSS